MKKLAFVCAVAAMIAATRSAGAADMALKAPLLAAPPPPPVYTWTGCYIGGNIGLVKQDTGISDPVGDSLLQPGTTWSNGIGFAAGGQVGCDYQINSNWVVGVRGMFDSANISQSISSVATDGETFYSAENFGIKTSWFATALARLGYLVVPDGLVYVKGGAAWKHVSYTDNGYTYAEECGGPEGLCMTFSGAASATILGWDFGAGFEYAFMPNLSAFVELDYMGFPSTATTLTYTTTSHSGGGPPFSTYSYNYTHDILTVLVGMNLRFHQ